MQNFGKVGNSGESIVLSVHRLPKSMLCLVIFLAYWQCMAWPLLEAKSEVTIKASNLQADTWYWAFRILCDPNLRPEP